MKICEALSAEHSIRQTNLIVEYIGTDPTCFLELIVIFLDARYTLTQRAARPLGIRGQGLSKWLMETMMQHPDLQGLHRWILATRDAHGLY